VVVWVVVMMPMFLAIAGLMIDAGQILDARREAQNLADGAARAGAMKLDLQQLHVHDVIQLDSAAAKQAATDYLSANERGRGWQPAIIPPPTTTITVTVTRSVPTTFLRILKIDTLATVSATGRAQPCAGIITGASTC
jgi:uncharacterized membrane protein